MAKKRRPGLPGSGDDDGTLVYSSGPDGSRSFGPGGKVADESGHPASRDLPPAEQKLRVVTDNKAAHGKTLTVVRGAQLTAASLEKLAKKLKQSCGTGGTVRGATIELQGDHVQRVRTLLEGMGYKVS